jgi:NAD(P)-dependent dehydrogenase (short-subunit alcohol dehydrogenase family)
MTMERRRPLDEEFQMPSFRLDNRVALVTGGSRGLGLGMALALAHAGADMAIVARNAEELAKAAELIRATGRQAFTIQADMGNIAQVQTLVPQVMEQCGRLDILVNCAGINIRQPFDTFTPEDWDRLMTINSKSVFFLSQAAARVMRSQGKGKIINVGSIALELVLPNIALYAVSKNALRGMTKALAIELAKDNIHVNMIAPGRYWTQMADAVFSDPERYDSIINMLPLGRPGIPADLAGATVLLASDASDYITGQTIFVDGGWTANSGMKG